MQTTFQQLDISFPRSVDYRNPNREPLVFESGTPFRHFPYRERHLQCLWADPRIRPTELTTTEGEPVIIEKPGDWNLEAGPDFLNAALLVGTEKRRITGDLEIHIHPVGWNQHGHAGDPRYKNVRFHLVYFQGLEIPGLIQIPLQESLTSDPRFSFDNIDLTAFPYSIPAGDFPLKEINPDRKTEFLENAGEERLRLKAERLMLALQQKEPEQVLWEELLATLGYKNNKAAFRKLATAFPLARLRSIAGTTDEAYALLLGLSGLLPSAPNPDWPPDAKAFFRSIWDFWWKQPERIKELAMEKIDWNLAGIRPTNHPVRRLMAAACYSIAPLQLLNHSHHLTEFPPNFWNTRLSWKTSCTRTALVGQSRANTIITNILVPFKAAIGETDIGLEHLPPEPSNSIIRQTAFTLFGPDHSDKVYRSALARQGLIQIFHDYLITHRLEELKKKFFPDHPVETSLLVAQENGGEMSPLSANAPHSAADHSTERQRGRCPSTLEMEGQCPHCPPAASDKVPAKQILRMDYEVSAPPPLPNRKHPARHAPVEHYNRMPIIFLTVCTSRHKRILNNSELHQSLLNSWKKSTHWIIGKYVIMPDHIHLFCSPTSKDSVSITNWSSYWKRQVSMDFPELKPIWQRDCWDTQLRAHESYSEKWSYIEHNPVRAGLVDHPDKWLFKGTINHLPW